MEMAVDVHGLVLGLIKGKQCGHQIWYRGRQWACVRPVGHEGDHACCDIDIRRFNDERPTSRSQYRSHLSKAEARIPAAPTGAATKEGE